MTFSAGTHYGPTTREISDVFASEVAAHGGAVLDEFDDGERLFLRATLPLEAEVRPGDAIKGGIAIRVSGPAILVHPFTVRQVCTNGAVMAQAHQSSRIERVAHDGIVVPGYDVALTLAQLSDGLRAAAVPEAFAQAMTEMRSSLDSEANVAFHLFPLLNRFPSDTAIRVFQMVLTRFNRGGDASVFGLMNALTSTARDESDPETRWALEVAGGELPVRGHAAQHEASRATSPSAR